MSPATTGTAAARTTRAKTVSAAAHPSSVPTPEPAARRRATPSGGACSRPHRGRGSPASGERRWHARHRRGARRGSGLPVGRWVVRETPDGMRLYSGYTTDPRYGPPALMRTRTAVRTPAGLGFELEQERMVELASLEDPLSLVQLADRIELKDDDGSGPKWVRFSEALDPGGWRWWRKTGEGHELEALFGSSGWLTELRVPESTPDDDVSLHPLTLERDAAGRGREHLVLRRGGQPDRGGGRPLPVGAALRPLRQRRAPGRPRPRPRAGGPVELDLDLRCRGPPSGGDAPGRKPERAAAAPGRDAAARDAPRWGRGGVHARRAGSACVAGGARRRPDRRPSGRWASPSTRRS